MLEGDPEFERKLFNAVLDVIDTGAALQYIVRDLTTDESVMNRSDFHKTLTKEMIERKVKEMIESGDLIDKGYCIKWAPHTRYKQGE